MNEGENFDLLGLHKRGLSEVKRMRKAGFALQISEQWVNV